MGIPVMVRWIDIAHYNGWFGDDDLLELSGKVMESVGYLSYENDDHVVISQDFADDGSYNGHGVIPKSVILNIVPIVLVDDSMAGDDCSG